MYNLIPFIIIIVSLSVIIVIVARKFKNIRDINIEHDHKFLQSKTKVIMMEKRMSRNFKVFWEKLKFVLKSSGGSKINQLIMLLQNRYQKLLEIKKAYKRVSKRQEQHEQEQEDKAGNISDPEKSKKIQEFLSEAKDLFNKKIIKEAEHKYIEIIGIEPKSIEAYRGLAEVYLYNKDYIHAETTLEHILKLVSTVSDRQAEDFASISLVKKELGKNAEAMHYLCKALEIEPQNPRYLDLYLESCILCKEKDTSWQVYRKLKEVNPENQKLGEFVEKIRTLGK